MQQQPAAAAWSLIPVRRSGGTPGSTCSRPHGESGSGILVSITPPNKLGWQPNAGGDFRRVVNGTLGVPAATELDTMLMLGVPTVAVRDIIDTHDAWMIDRSFCSADGSYLILSVS